VESRGPRVLFFSAVDGGPLRPSLGFVSSRRLAGVVVARFPCWRPRRRSGVVSQGKRSVPRDGWSGHERGVEIRRPQPRAGGHPRQYLPATLQRN